MNDTDPANEIENPYTQAVIMPLSRIPQAAPGCVMAVTDADGHAVHYTIPAGAIAVRITAHALVFIGADGQDMEADVVIDPPVEDGQPLPR